MNSLPCTTIGRFAPTPSGPLHFGSLVTAVASYCHVKSVNGRWLLRIEDLDTPRVIKGSAENILTTLEAYGFEWDAEVLYQSQRFPYYEEVLQNLIQQGLVYACHCSRKSLHTTPHTTGPMGIIYPGFCRQKKLPFDALSYRLNIDSAGSVEFIDEYFGLNQLNLPDQIGDIILKRRDGIYAYHLAVIIDDAYQQVNQIVRGADLLSTTALHLHLNKLLGFSPAQYLHVPLIKNSHGQKLSKQTGATAISIDTASLQLIQALKVLGQPTPVDLNQAKPTEILAYACAHWDSDLI